MATAPDRVLSYDSDPIEPENPSSSHRQQVLAKLQRSFDQSERGETYTAEEARVILAKRRAERSTH